MKLKKFKVKNYKGFKEELIFNLKNKEEEVKPMVIIYGEGKTNLFTAILNGLTDFRYDYKPYFPINKHNIKFTFDFDSDDGQHIRLHKVFNHKLEKEREIGYLDGKECTKLVRTLVNRFVWTNVNYIDLEEMSKSIIRDVDYLRWSEHSLKLFQKYLNDLDVHCEMFMDKNGNVFYTKDNTTLPFTNMTVSESMRYLVRVYTKVHNSKSKLLLLDDFGYISNKYSKKLINYLKNKEDISVVATSNNTSLINSSLLNPKDYYVIKKDKIKSFDRLTDKELRKTHNLEKMYVAGHFNDWRFL